MDGLPGNIADIFATAQRMKQDVERLQSEAATKEVEASAGGGVITVRMNGAQQLVSITIDPTVVDPKDITMLQDLVKAAVNEASRKSKEFMKAELAKVTGGLPIPGL